MIINLPLKYLQILIILKVKLALSNSNNDRKIEYRILRSKDTSWYTINSEGLVSISNLTEGKYIFEARATSNSTLTEKVTLTILPHWYNTWWARTLFAGLFLWLVYIVFSWQWHNAQNKFLTKQETQRKKMMAIIAHDLNSPINNFSELAANVQYLLKTNDFETIETISQEMGEKSKNLQLLINNILLWTMTTEGLMKAKTEYIDINEIFNEVIPIYSDIANYRNIKIETEIEIQNQESFISDKVLLSTIFRNLVDNSIKYCQDNSTIKIKFSSKIQNKLTISNTITDNNGEALARFFNNLFSQKEKPSPYSDGIGFGTSILYESMVLINAKPHFSYINNLLLIEVYFQN